MTKTYIIVALVSYLLGSIPFGYILVKLFLKQDIRATGSGNIGATNVARSGAKGLAVATLLLDALKGALAVWIAAHVAESVWNPYLTGAPVAPWFFAKLMTLGALMAVLGHMFPVWLRFKGGKGVATAVGAFAVLAPLAILVVLAVFIIVVGITRYVSLGSIVAAVLFPAFSGWLYRSTFLSSGRGLEAYVVLCLVSLLVILKHHENIRRLLAGTENKFGGQKSVPTPGALEKRA